MSGQRFSFFVLFFFFLFSTFGNNYNKKPFKVTIKGPSQIIETLKKKGELKMARSVDFCRGFMIPARSAPWSCKSIGDKEMQCHSLYQCKLITRNFSRMSETRRLIQDLKKFPRSKTKFKMTASRRPFISSHFKTTKSFEKQKVHAEPLGDRKIKGSLGVKRKIIKYNEFSELEKKIGSMKKDSNIIEVKEESEVTDLAQMKKELEEGAKGNNIEAQIPFREKEEVSKLKSLDLKESGPSRYRLLSFEGALTKISDINADSSVVIDLAWTPRLKINSDWSLSGHFGGHSLKRPISEESETFFLIDISAHVQYRVWKRFFIEAGPGLQKWNSSIGGAYGTFSLAGSWQFKNYQLKFIDKFFVSYMSVGNEESNKELKLGVGISF